MDVDEVWERFIRYSRSIDPSVYEAIFERSQQINERYEAYKTEHGHYPWYYPLDVPFWSWGDQ